MRNGSWRSPWRALQISFSIGPAEDVMLHNTSLLALAGVVGFALLSVMFGIFT
ncbi:MAG: hypothetical protein VKJ66_07380 [Synechococcus sp.]|nr:hypothetical protein [Synechococcus sp.]